MNYIEEIENLNIGEVIPNINLKDYTTYKAGGNALALVIPDDITGLINLIKYLRNKKIKYKILGNGSNLLFSDSFYEGILIKLDNFNRLEINDNYVTAGAGYSLMKLSLRTARAGLTGLEFASGIPGTDTNGVVTDYQFPDENTSNSSVEQEQIQYEINKIKTETNKSVGGIQFDRSSIGIVLSK